MSETKVAETKKPEESKAQAEKPEKKEKKEKKQPTKEELLAKSIAKSFIKKTNKRKDKQDEKDSGVVAPTPKKKSKNAPTEEKTGGSKVIADLMVATGLYKKAEKLYLSEEEKVIAYVQ